MQLLCVYVEFRISEGASSGYQTFQLVMQGTNPLCLLSVENYSSLTTSAGLPKSNSSWPTRRGISCITSVHGRSGAAICNHYMLGIWMYVGQTNTHMMNGLISQALDSRSHACQV